MSRSRRTEALAAFAAASVALVGCMRIYPDPELPDVEVTWYAEDCRDGTTDVSLALVGLDDRSRVEMTVPCSALQVTFADVPRQRYRVEGELLDDAGEIFSDAEVDIDLRNGIDAHVELFLGGFADFRVGWTFDMGATCASLGADLVVIDVHPIGYSQYARCDSSPYLGYAGGSTFALQLRAVAGPTTLAISAQTEEFTSDPFDLVDVGVLSLTPCNDPCVAP